MKIMHKTWEEVVDLVLCIPYDDDKISQSLIDDGPVYDQGGIQEANSKELIELEKQIMESKRTGIGLEHNVLQRYMELKQKQN